MSSVLALHDARRLGFKHIWSAAVEVSDPNAYLLAGADSVEED